MVAAGPPCSARIGAALKRTSAATSRTLPHRNQASWALIDNLTSRQNLPDEKTVATQPFLHFLGGQHKHVERHARAEQLSRKANLTLSARKLRAANHQQIDVAAFCSRSAGVRTEKNNLLRPLRLDNPGC